MIELNFSPFPILQTERLLLRSLQQSDANEIFALRSDDNVNKYIERQKATSIKDAHDFIERITQSISNNESILWAIELKKEKAFAGSVLIFHVNTEKDEAELGYEILPKHQGKGIAQEAIKAALTFAFDVLKVKTIAAVVHKENIPSLKIIEKNNFHFKMPVENNMMEYILTSESFIR